MELTFNVELKGCWGHMPADACIYPSMVRDFRNQLLTGGLTGYDSFRIVAGVRLPRPSKTYFKIIKQAQQKHAIYTARVNDKITALITRTGNVRFLDGNTGDSLPIEQVDSIIKPFDGLDIADYEFDTRSFSKFSYNLRLVSDLYRAMQQCCHSDIILPQYIQVSDTRCVDLQEILIEYQHRLDVLDWRHGPQIIDFNVGVYPWGNDDYDDDDEE